MSEHVCERCGKPLDPVNWWTLSLRDRYGGNDYKLCKLCAMELLFPIQRMILLFDDEKNNDKEE